MDTLQIKYDALQQSYDALRSDLKIKDKLIDNLAEQNKKLQATIDQYETNSSNNDSLDSGSSKNTNNNIYDKNLQIINESVTDDEFKFMQDLSREKNNNDIQFGVEPRSNIIKKAHTDAEEEFFLLSVLSCKIDLATKGCSNAAVSDISPQSLWNRAQEKCISMHQFHDWIMSQLLKVYQSTQQISTKITHKWSSYQSTVIADKLRQDDLQNYAKNNPDLQIVDPEQTSSLSSIHRNNINRVINRPKYDSPKQLIDEEQILTDDESDIDDEQEAMYQSRRRQNQLNITTTNDLL